MKGEPPSPAAHASTGLERFRAMGCDVLVGGAGPGELDAIRRLFAERERTFSRFLPSSELSRVNASTARGMLVSRLFAATLEQALGAAAATGGLVDPTLGAALVAAGYDRDFPLLSDASIRSAAPTAERHGWRAVALEGRLLTRPRGLVLDLNGVVKGLAVDDAVALLAADGFVSAGGDVAARGSCAVGLPGGGTVSLHGGALATSGTSSRTWMQNGVRQHHLVDPRTGRPSRSRWRTVTVAASSCLAADVAAKASFLLDVEGPGWLDALGLPGRFVSRQEIVENAAWRSSIERWAPESVPA